MTGHMAGKVTALRNQMRKAASDYHEYEKGLRDLVVRGWAVFDENGRRISPERYFRLSGPQVLLKRK